LDRRTADRTAATIWRARVRFVSKYRAGSDPSRLARSPSVGFRGTQSPNSRRAESAAAPVAGLASAPAASEAQASVIAAPEGLIELKVSGESWIEVLDASGAVLLQRKLDPGEFVGLDGTPPFRLKIGNAAVTRLSYRGQPVDLAAATRDNVARLELK